MRQQFFLVSILRLIFPIHCKQTDVSEITWISHSSTWKQQVLHYPEFSETILQ